LISDSSLAFSSEVNIFAQEYLTVECCPVIIFLDTVHTNASNFFFLMLSHIYFCMSKLHCCHIPSYDRKKKLYIIYVMRTS